MAIKLEFDIVADAKNATRNLSKFDRDAQRHTGSVSASFGRMGKAMVAAVGIAATGAIANQGRELYKLGQQVEGWGLLSGAVFKDHRREVQKWAEDNRRSFGVGAAELEGYIAQVGQMLKAQGFAGESLSGMSTEIAEMAGNASLLSGGTVSMTDALGKFTALIRGERDPIESLGVSVKDIDIQARLAEEGLTGLTGEARKMAEASASIAIAQEQLADQMKAAGLVTNEETLAMASDFATMKEKIGTAAYELGNDVAGGIFNFIEGEHDDFWSRMGRDFDAGVLDLEAGFDDLGDTFKTGFWELDIDTRNLATVVISTFAIILRAFSELISGLWNLGGTLLNAMSWPFKKVEEFASGVFHRIGQSFAGPFGGLMNLGRQHGGSVASQTPYMVGEKGPELFVPGSSGAIVPNIRSGGGGGGSTYTINVSAATSSPSEVGEAIVDAISQYERIGGAGWRA